MKMVNFLLVGIFIFSFFNESVGTAADSENAAPKFMMIPTSRPEITVDMGLEKLLITNQENQSFDGLEYSPAMKKGLASFQRAKKIFPRFVSPEIESYFLELSFAFAQTLPQPKPRFHFYFANTINPAIWSLGGGFFVIHAGILHLFPHPRELAFWILLEMAHESLGHQAVILSEKSSNVFEIDRWAMEATPDPVIRSGLVYTEEQETAALKLIQNFLFIKGIDVKELGASAFSKIKELADREPDKVSLYLLHQHLIHALAWFEIPPAKENIKIDWNPDLSAKLKRHLQYYPWLFEEHSNEWAETYFKARALYEKQNWKALLKLTKHFFEANSNLNPMEPFQDLHVKALQMNESFLECIRFLKQPWPYYDSARELYNIQCVFLEGYITEAHDLALKYHSRYPLDLEGTFWKIAIEIKMREDIQSDLATVLNFWGDRPTVRSLRALDFGYRHKYTEATAQFQFISEIRYSATEAGTFEFANSWVRRSFSVFHDKDSTAIDYDQLSEKHWPISKLLKINFPRLE